jgi:hypothetical protein
LTEHSTLEDFQKTESELDRMLKEMKTRDKGTYKIVFLLIRPDGLRVEEKPFLSFEASTSKEAVIRYEHLVMRTNGAFNNYAIVEHGSVGKAIRGE